MSKNSFVNLLMYSILSKLHELKFRHLCPIRIKGSFPLGGGCNAVDAQRLQAGHNGISKGHFAHNVDHDVFSHSRNIAGCLVGNAMYR